MARYITELLDAVNKDPSVLQTPQFKGNYAVTTVLQYAFDKRARMVLPDGTPPFNPAPEPLGMTPSNFYQTVKKMYIFRRTDVSRLKLESAFIQTLEGIHPTEAAVLVAVKDQNLEQLYPNITTEVVVNAGLVPAEFAKEAVVVEPPKSVEVPAPAAQDPTEPKHLVLNIDDSAGATEQLGGGGEKKAPSKKTRRSAA